MEFEDLKVIWDTQNDQPLYGVNETGLRKILQDKSRRFARLVFWQEFQTYGATLFVILQCVFVLFVYFEQLEILGISVELTGWDITALFIAVGLWVPHTLGTYVRQRRQKKRDREMVTSLQDTLNRDIEQMDDQIRARRNLPWVYLPPHIGISLYLLVWFRFSGTSLWLMLPMICIQIIALLWETRAQKRLALREMVPRKRELEALREKLRDPKL